MTGLKPKLLPRASASRLTLLLSAIFLSSSLRANYEEILYTNNFSGDTIGAQPAGFDHLLPVTNVGTESPMQFQLEDGPVGALIVGESTQPSSSLPGTGNQSLRIYDWTSQGTHTRAYLAKNFVVNGINNRFDARLDLTFKRSVFHSQNPDFPGDRLLIAFGGWANGLSFNSGANRALEVSVTNEGTWQAHGTAPEGIEGDVTGSYDGDGVNGLTVVANAHPDDDLTYDGPEGSHTLAPYTYSLYINGVRVADGMGFRNNMPIGRLGFLTGFNAQAAEIDFVVDDIVVTGLRETELLEFSLDVNIDFEEFTEGTRPTGFTRASPTVPVGPTEPFPVTASADGPHGVLIVDENSSPVPSFNGKSVRIYDYHSNARAKLSQIFIPDGEDPVPHIRFDFSFRRSVAMVAADGNPGQGMIVGLGTASTAQTMHVGAGRALQLQILNNGTIRVAGESFTTPLFQFEPFDEIGTNDISIFANVQDESITYDGPDGSSQNLDGRHFSVFLNGQPLSINRPIKTGFPTLGKFAFTTGQGVANTHHDFVVDDIRVSDFGGPREPPVPPVLRIGKGAETGSLLLSWNSTNNETYGLEHSADLVNWEPTGATFTGDGSAIEHTVTFDAEDRRFFRVISPVEIIIPGTPAVFSDTHQVRLWTTGENTGTYAYNTFQNGQVGKSGGADVQRSINTIHGFQLPTLEHEMVGATYTLTKTGHNGNPDWDAQIYLFDPNTTPTDQAAESIYWSAPAEDPNTLLRTITLNAFNQTTQNGELSFTLTAADLAGFYNPDGTPASAEGKIWIRVNAGKPTEEISNFERLDIESDLQNPNAPTLRFSEPE